MPSFEAAPCVRLVLRWKPQRDECGYLRDVDKDFGQRWHRFVMARLHEGVDLVERGGGSDPGGTIVAWVKAEHWDTVRAWLREQGVKER